LGIICFHCLSSSTFDNLLFTGIYVSLSHQLDI